MINLTNTQKNAMRELALCKVIYKKMYKKDGQLGYTSPSRRYYDITIASDIGNQDVSDIVLLHEIGHCYFGHNDIDIKTELLVVKQMLEAEGLDFRNILRYGGPMRFLNIAMDLEINSKLLTRGNIKTMADFGFRICTPEGFEIETADSFRSYYLPLIKALKDEDFSFDASSNSTGDDLAGECEATGVDEIDDALSKEGYISGELKSADKSNNTSESTVGKEQQDIERGEQSRKKSNGRGKGSQTQNRVKVYENSSKTLESFLKSILHSSLRYNQNAIRIWNRGIRNRNSGILYNSYRQDPKRVSKKLGILVDVSGSMDIDSIVQAASSLQNCANVLDSKSSLVTWNESKVDEFLLKDIPSYLKCGGGTDIVKGIEYLKDNGFTDIVVYSDFETPNLNSVSNKGVNLYSIVVKASWRSNDLDEFLTKNKKHIYVE